MATLDNTLEPALVHTIEELARVFRCSPEDITDWRIDSKSIASGPPFNVGKVAIELLKSKRLDRSVFDAGTVYSGVPQAVAVEIVRGSLVAGMKGDVLESAAAIYNASRYGKNETKYWKPVYKRENIVIAVSKPKTAALLFDRVWTIDREVPGSIGIRTNDESEFVALGFRQALFDLFEPQLEGEEKTKKMEDLASLPDAEGLFGGFFQHLLQPSLSKLTRRPIQTYFASDETLSATYASGSTSMIIAVLDSLNWIDESKLTWKHVVDIRMDANALGQLQRMLHWLDTGMEGKSASFIEDAILLKIDEYKKAIAKHGIKLFDSAFGTFMDARLLTTIMSGAVGGAAFHSTAAVLTALASLGLHSVNVAYKTVQVHRESNSAINANPIAYLHSVKDKSDR